MQILYAAPFLLVAAICFFVCAAVGRIRKQALVLPVGVLCFGVGSIVAYFVFVLITDKLGYRGSANWFYLIPYVGGGLIVAIVCAALYRMIVAVLPKWLISVGLVAATFASSLIFLPFCSWAIARLTAVDYVHIEWMVVPGLVCLTVASAVSWRIVRITEEFRPAPCLRRVITRMFPHHENPRRDEPTTSRAYARLRAGLRSCSTRSARNTFISD